jgi:hypothetical protein
MEWKYIVVGDADIIIFPANLEHATVAGGWKVTSAGTIDFGRRSDGFGFSCYGSSVSLAIGSDPVRDTALANRLLRDRLGESLTEMVQDEIARVRRG